MTVPFGMRFAAGPFVGRRLFATGVPLGDRYKLRHSPVGPVQTEYLNLYLSPSERFGVRGSLLGLVY